MEAHRRRIQRQREPGAPPIPTMDMSVDDDSDDESMAGEAPTSQPANPVASVEGKHPAAERRQTMSVYAVLSPTPSSSESSPRGGTAVSGPPLPAAHSLAAYRPPPGPAHGVRLPPMGGERQQLPPGLHAAGSPALDRGGGGFGQRDGVAPGMATEPECPCRVGRVWAYCTGDCKFR
jgi:hypothetical protein